MVTVSAEAYHAKPLRTSRIPFVFSHGSKNQSIIEQEGFRRRHDDKISCQDFACFNL